MGATADDSMLPAKSQSNSTGPAGGTGNEKNPQNIDQQSLTTRKQQQEDDRVWVQGSKNANVVRAYLASCGWGLVALTLMLTVCSHALGAWKESILAGWSTTQPGNASGYLWLYVGASLVVILSNFLKMYGSMWAGLAASKSLHQRLLSAILGAPLQFFDTTPSGRIANRFSADIDAIDFTLPEGLMAMLESVLMMVTGVGVVVASTPMFLLFLAPLMYFYIQFQQLYRRTSTELKILDSSTKSPIFSQYREALDGLDTIRGYRIQDVVILKHNRLMDDQQRARLNWDAANRWLGVRLDVIGTLLISSAALVVIIGVQSGQIQPGYAGYALAFALGATKGFGFTVRSLTALENTFVACDRVLQYTRLRQEDTQLPSLTDPEALPEREPLLHATEESLELGEIPREEALIVRDLVVSYGLDLPNALDGVSITVSRGTTLGICGRTGCGKSTLSLSLARGVEALRGEILVNGVDVSKMNLRDLRARVQVFPQDSYVFAGTVEEVIDPWKKASAATLQRIANELLQLFVQETPKVLQTSELTSTQALLQFQIDKGGTNISAGQRQLLSLARAVISEAHVVVLDECCSQMDPSISHLALRFVKSTLTRRGAAVLLIAHRWRC
jgi:ABC-type multidrug transport system fused ATPase/permease subunit